MYCERKPGATVAAPPSRVSSRSSGQNQAAARVSNLGRNFCRWLCRRGHRVVGDDLLHSRRKLRALSAPVRNLHMLQLIAGRVSAGIVGAHNLDGAAFAGAVLLNHDNAVIRLLAGAETRQTNHNHDEPIPFEFLSLSKMNRMLPSRIPILHSLCERESHLWFCATMASTKVRTDAPGHTHLNN